MKNRENRTRIAPRTIPNPTSFHLIVRPDDVEEVTESGIVLTNYENQLDYEQNGAVTGYVLKMGPTCYEGFAGDPWCKVDDHIHFKRHVADMINDPENVGKKLFLINDENVLGVYDE